MGPDILRENFPLLIPILALMIPIVAIVGGLSIPILYIVTQFKKRQQMLEQNPFLEVDDDAPPPDMGLERVAPVERERATTTLFSSTRAKFILRCWGMPSSLQSFSEGPNPPSLFRAALSCWVRLP